MRRCIIHFGMHKTGSSSIQATLYKGLDGERFHYFDLGVYNPTGPLKNIFMPPRERFKDIGNRGSRLAYDDFLVRRESTRARLMQEIEKVTARNLIISAEGLNYLSESELAEFRDMIALRFEKFLLVGYVRKPKGFMESIFQQRVKGNLDQLELETLYPGYRDRFERFEKVFGRPNVQYWDFDPRSFPEGCVVRDFCRRLGIPVPKEEIVRVNEGLSRAAMAFLFTYRQHFHKFAPRRNFIRENLWLVERLAQLGGPKLRFASDLVRPVLRRKAADVRWMERRLGSSLSEDLGDEAGAIRSEEDLLCYDAGSLQWLAAQLGSGHETQCHPSMAPEEVAALVHQLRVRIAEGRRPARKGRPSGKGRKEKQVGEITALELVAGAKEISRGILAEVPDARAADLVMEAFALISRKVEQTEEEMLNVGGLGQFRVRPVQLKMEGNKVIDRRVIFSPVKRREE